MPQYEVIDSEFNRANYAKLIGKKLVQPPAYAQVKEVDTGIPRISKPTAKSGSTQKAKGVLAQLITRDKNGQRIDSHIVWRPYCDIYMTDLHDSLAETEFTDPGALADEFGHEVAEMVFNGQIVEVERVLGPNEELRGCPPGKQKFIRVNYQIRYPGEGIKEDLMSEATAKKLGYMGP